MSKTAQRKFDAYHKGYAVGRHGLWNKAGCYRFGRVGARHFDKGREDGRRDRLAALGPKKRTFWQKLKYVLGIGV